MLLYDLPAIDNALLLMILMVNIAEPASVVYLWYFGTVIDLQDSNKNSFSAYYLGTFIYLILKDKKS